MQSSGLRLESYERNEGMTQHLQWISYFLNGQPLTNPQTITSPGRYSVWVIARDYASNETQMVKSFAIPGEQILGHIVSPTEGELTRQSVTDVAVQIESPAGIASAHATSMSVTACDA